MKTALTVEGGRTVIKDGKAWFSIKRESIEPVQADALTHYLASKFDQSEFEQYLHDYKNS